jgi:hypothetical protein
MSENARRQAGVADRSATQQMINAIGTWGKDDSKDGVKALLAASNCRAVAHLATRRVMLCKTFAWIRSACRPHAVEWCASAAVMFVPAGRKTNAVDERKESHD